MGERYRPEPGPPEGLIPLGVIGLLVEACGGGVEGRYSAALATLGLVTVWVSALAFFLLLAWRQAGRR